MKILRCEFLSMERCRDAAALLMGASHPFAQCSPWEKATRRQIRCIFVKTTKMEAKRV